MAMYETIFILDSLLAPEEIDKTVDRIKEVIETNQGKVLTIDKWGKRRLAFCHWSLAMAVRFDPSSTIRLSFQT